MYKSCKSLFESIKRKPKRVYYSSKRLEFKSNEKKTWGVLKKLMSKTRNTESSSPKKLVTEKKNEKEKEITEIKNIAEEFYNFFTNAGPNLTQKSQILQSHSLVS